MKIKTLLLTAMFALAIAAGLTSAEKPETTPEKKDLRTLKLNVKSNGMPGAKEGDENKTVEQTLWIRGEHLKMTDNKNKLATIIRLDVEEVWQINGNYQVYRKVPFSFFKKKRKDYLATREAAKRKTEKMTGKERQTTIEKYGFKTDMLGNITGDIPPEVVETDNTSKINGFNCRLVVLKEYGREAVKAWVTDEVKRPGNMLRFYSELNLFHPGLVEKIKKVTDFPVKLEITIDFGTLYNKTFTTEVTDVASVEKPEDFFDIPEGVVQVEKMPRQLPCPVCGKKVIIEDAKKKGLTFQYDLVIYHFCCKECKEKFKDYLRKKLTRPSDDDEEDDEEPPLVNPDDRKPESETAPDQKPMAK